jgi:putative spermidine/putrescine transport system substrate-binding protein
VILAAAVTAGVAVSVSEVGGATASNSAGKSLVVEGGTGVFGACERQAYFKPFTAKTGIKIIEAPEDDNPATRIKLAVTSHHYNVTVESDYSSTALSSQASSLLEPINYKLIPKRQVVPGLALKYAVPWSTYSYIVAYNKKALNGKTPTRLADFFDLTNFPGKRAMFDYIPSAIIAALLADGVSPSKLIPFDLDRAFKKLDTIKKDLILVNTGSQLQQLIDSGEVSMEMTYPNRVFSSIQAGEPEGAIWDGHQIAANFFMIPKGDPNAALGQKFIAFVLSKAISGRLSYCQPAGPGNVLAKVSKAAIPYLPTSHLNLPHVVDDGAAVGKWITQNNQTITDRWNAWKAGVGH